MGDRWPRRVGLSSSAARILERSDERVRQLARAGVLPTLGRSEDGHWLFDLDAVERFRAEREAGAVKVPA